MTAQKHPKALTASEVLMLSMQLTYVWCYNFALFRLQNRNADEIKLENEYTPKYQHESEEEYFPVTPSESEKLQDTDLDEKDIGIQFFQICYPEFGF